MMVRKEWLAVISRQVLRRNQKMPILSFNSGGYFFEKATPNRFSFV